MQKKRMKLAPGSLYELLAAHYIEGGCSPSQTAFFVNMHLKNDGAGYKISASCIRRLIQRLDPVISKYKKTHRANPNI